MLIPQPHSGLNWGINGKYSENVVLLHTQVPTEETTSTTMYVRSLLLLPEQTNVEEDGNQLYNNSDDSIDIRH